MNAPFPRLTVFLGPPSQHALGLNNVVRMNRDQFSAAGLTAMPNRLGGPALRAVTNKNASLEEREAALDALFGEQPAFCVAMKFLGSLRKGMQSRELLPDGKAQVAALGEVAAAVPMRVIVAPDNLPDVFFAEASAALDGTIRGTHWEVLYDLSWVDMIANLREALPLAEILILTQRGFALGGSPLIAGLFGAAAEVIQPRMLLFQSLNATGRAVLEQIDSDAEINAVMARELYDTFAERADDAACRDRLGMDRLTVKLLSQRFNEDLEQLRFMNGVSVL